MNPTIPKHTIVNVPQDRAVTLRCVRVPIETPAGILDGSAMQVEIDGQKYQILGSELGAVVSTLYEAIDVETGDIVCLRFPGTF